MTDNEALFFAERHDQDPARPSEVRTEYERDRARIIHSAAFRRLQGKTQVMGVGEGDFHRTRLTHSIGCAQIGAGLLDQLQRSGNVPTAFKPWFPSKELIEAACFAHDLGHPPFGHGGERALLGKMREAGGFEGNAHTLRILTTLEKHSLPGRGINPTRRLVLAILKYPRAYATFTLTGGHFKRKPAKCFFDNEQPIVRWAFAAFNATDKSLLSVCDIRDKPLHRTFDCSVMKLADDIAYGVHDIEDIVARRLSSREDVVAELTSAFTTVGGALDTQAGLLDPEVVSDALFKNSYTRKQMIGRLVNTFMTAATVHEETSFTHPCSVSG